MHTSQTKPVIGLIGGIGAGKSLVARQLGELGCAVIDADQLTQAALEREDIKRQLVAWWGDGMLGLDGQVDRRAVAQKVFDSEQELTKLENLIHPIVKAERQRLRAAYQADDRFSAIVDDTPLLLEKGLDKDCDVLIFVQTSRPVRLRRVVAGRGWTEAELSKREKRQWPLDKKAARADYVVVNEAGEAECLSHVRRVFSKIIRAD